MKKIIDIPDEIVKDLKIMAVKNDRDLKNYLQDLISNHYRYNHTSEFAVQALEDGQITRSIWNYIHQTYIGLANEKFDFDDYTFTDFESFVTEVKATCDMILKAEKEIKKDEQNGGV